MDALKPAACPESGVERVARLHGLEAPEIAVSRVNSGSTGIRQRRDLRVCNQIAASRGGLLQEMKRALQMGGAWQ
jgi:hypothetical protein